MQAKYSTPKRSALPDDKWADNAAVLLAEVRPNGNAGCTDKPKEIATVDAAVLTLARLLGRQAAQQSMALPPHACDANHET